MPRRPKPDLATLPTPAADSGTRGVRVVTPTELGEVVRTVRAQRLGRQGDAAARLGLGVGVVGALERGDRGVGIDTVLGVLADLGLDVVLVPRDAGQSLRSAP